VTGPRRLVSQAVQACAICSQEIVWDPDEPTRQHPRFRHTNQTAAILFGAHRATLALSICSACGHDAPHRKDTGCPHDNNDRAQPCRCTARVDIARPPIHADIVVADT
jgi:hypothetical protein